MRKNLYAFLFLGLMLMGFSVRAEVIDRILAIVGDEIITLSDFNKFRDQLKSGGLTDDILIPDEKTRQAVLNNPDKLLDKMIEEKLIDAEIKRQNLTVPFEQVDQEIRATMKKNRIGREELVVALKERGLTLSQYQDFIRKGLERQAVISKSVQAKVKVSEDEVNLIFMARYGYRDTQMFEYTLSHILFVDEEKNGKSPQDRAEDVLKQIRAGASFEKLASTYSEDPNFSENGLLGTFRSGEFLKELEQVVRKLNPGDISPPVKTAAGWHILKVAKKRAISDPSDDEKRQGIRAEKYEEGYKSQLKSWLEQIRSDAFVRINPK